MTRWVTETDGEIKTLPKLGNLRAEAHVYEERAVRALNAALAACRPLLVRGEPGTGKSQLARAAAHSLGRPLVSQVVDARTTARDLLWTFDAVARLGTAQLLGALRSVVGTAEGALERKLNERNFVRPGPLWWALDWKEAEMQADLAHSE